MNTSVQNTPCPYCKAQTSVDLPKDYAPVYLWCDLCKKKFIIERLAKGFQTLTIEEAPCCSDPDCREIEMGGSDEQ